MLQLADVAVRRGPNRVVERLDLAIRPGVIFWILGPNGAGKTSLLRVMAGLDAPLRGSVRRGGGAVRFLYFHPAMTPPDASTVGDWERLTERLLSAGAHPAHLPLWPDVEARRRVSRLSTGERKRLVLDTLLRRDGPLLLDEPFEHLSPDAKRSLLEILEERARTAVVVVATNQLVAGMVAGAGLWLEGGIAEPLPGAWPRTP